MPFTQDQAKQLNQLLEQSKLFDKQYTDHKNPTRLPEQAVFSAHQNIITSYETLLQENSEIKPKDRADIYTNMHVQYEGLRKYYGICYDFAQTIDVKNELLDKQTRCTRQCILYTEYSRDYYASKKDKTWASDYLKQYHDVKSRLDNAKNELEKQTSSSTSSISSTLSPDEAASECADALLGLASSPRANSPLEIIDRCWRDLHNLSQSEAFSSHPQCAHVLKATLLLASSKIALEAAQQEVLSHDSFSHAGQSFFTLPTTRTKRRHPESTQLTPEHVAAHNMTH
ncbi:MAG: hypothetical protein P1U39_07460 [Legionellaceae bacterium]|nr:hypothetical protein [Legionellaceae bacterium]